MIFACWVYMKVLAHTELALFPFVNILLGVQDMYRQSSAESPKIGDIPLEFLSNNNQRKLNFYHILVKLISFYVFSSVILSYTRL